MKVLAPAYWSTACAELAAADPVMAGLIARYPDSILANRGDPFQTLARAIVGQQISVTAADSVWTRFADFVPRIDLGLDAGDARNDRHRGPAYRYEKLNTAMQIVYPTLFLVYNTKDKELEVALCRAYNRFLAQACAQSGGLMKWVVVLPLQSMDAAIDEIRFAKQNGAVGVFFRGIEGDFTLDHPYLFPVYEEAQKHNLSICVHTGCGVKQILEMFDLARNHTFGHTRVMPLLGFRDLVANKIPERFPGLRFGFVEAAAGWAPFLMHIIRHSTDRLDEYAQLLSHGRVSNRKSIG